MRHSRIMKSNRHKKMKVVQNPSNYNMIEDGLLQKNKSVQPVLY